MNSLTRLNSQEEIALRRLAHGAAVDSHVAERLEGLALIQRTKTGYRLTPLGQLLYNALPKAPLLSRPRSIHAVTGYVEGLIDKARSRARARTVPAEADDAFHAPLPGGSNHEGDERGGQTNTTNQLVNDNRLPSRRRRNGLC